MSYCPFVQWKSVVTKCSYQYSSKELKFYSAGEKKVILAWNDMRVSK